MYCDLNKVLQFKKKPFEILSINTNTYFYNLFKKFEKKTKKNYAKKNQYYKYTLLYKQDSFNIIANQECKTQILQV